jgi:hypothetical protein
MFSFLYHCHDFYRTWLYIWVTRRVSYKKQELPTLRKHLSSSPVFFVGSVLLIFLVFCVVLLCVFTFLFVGVFMFYLRYLCVFVHCGVQHKLCFVFLRLVYPMLAVSLDFTFLISLRYSLTFISHTAASQIHPWIDFPVIIWGTYFWFHQKRTTCFENSESLKIIK